MTVKNISFKSWEDYKSNILKKIVAAQKKGRVKSNHKLDDYRLVFRGQACESWDLEATFDRYLREVHKILDADGPAYEKFLKSFVQRGLEYEILEELGLEGDEREFYFEAIARHQGLPTRLLDWSHSPYIAAFFAFTEHKKCTTGEIAIWCLDVDNTKISSYSTIEVKERPKKGNFRQLSQQGLYTRNISNKNDLAEYFKKSEGRFDKLPPYPILFKCTIPATEYKKALLDLELMGISSLTMFNDMEGLVEYQKNELEIYSNRFISP